MNTQVKQNYIMIQGEYLDGTPGVEMVAGGFENYKLGDEFSRLYWYKDSSPWVIMGDDPKRYHRDEIKPWVIIKIFNAEEQAILRAIERVHSGTAIENLFASNVEKMRTRVYSVPQ